MLLRHFQSQEADCGDEGLPIGELDDEMAELLFNTVRKLESISDEAFAELYIAPDSMTDD